MPKLKPRTSLAPVAPAPQTTPGQLLYSVPQAAECLAYSASHVWTLVRTGAIQSIKAAKSRRITRQALEAYIAGLSSQGDGNTAA